MVSWHARTLLSSELGRRRLLLRPWEPDAADLMGSPGEGLYLGRSQLMAVPVFWDFKRLANPHMAIVGMSGSGKSYLVKTFIGRAWRQWGAGALVLDWSGEYAPWVEGAGGSVVPLGRGAGLNLLDCRLPPPEKGEAAPASELAGTPRLRIEQALSALALLGDLGAHPRQMRLTRQAMEEAFSARRLPLDRPLAATFDARKLPTLHDVADALRRRLKRSAGPDVEGALARLEPFCLPGGDYLARPGGLPLSSLVGPRLVSVDLSALPSDAHRSLAGLTILQYLKERMRREDWAAHRRLKLIVVADEAWKIAQDDSSDLVAILREGRKYAFGLVVASQDPADLSDTILSNAGTLAVFRLMLGEYRERLRRSLRLPSEMADSLERLGVGQCLVRMAWDRPGALDRPFMISRIAGDEPVVRWRLQLGGPDMEVEHMGIELEREEFRKRLWRLGLSDTQLRELSQAFDGNGNRLGAEELARRLSAFGLSRSATLNFLRSLGMKDADLLALFGRLQAQSLGVSPSQMVELGIKPAARPPSRSAPRSRLRESLPRSSAAPSRKTSVRPRGRKKG